MKFNDDEPPPPPPRPANSSAGREPIHRGSDRVRLVAYSNDKAPLEENEQQVLLELVDTSSASERSGLDLVAVLDVSGSMKGPKLDKLKTAMKFVISKLGPMDRLSIVSFSDDAKRRCRLRLMTGDAKEELKGIVETELSAGGYTNIRGGLEMGLKVLADRPDNHKIGRVSAVVLMSDGYEKPKPLPSYSASKVRIDDVAVYTFGFGENHDAKVLRAIANNSQGGTFLYVKDNQSLTKRFAEIMAGLLSVTVQDLKLTVWPQPGHSTIQAVVAGSYLPELTEDGSGHRVRFGDLFGGEVRKIVVHLHLPAVHCRGYRATVIFAQCSYRIHGDSFYSPRDGQLLRCVMHRTGSASRDATKKKPEVEEELDRILYVNMIKDAIAMDEEISARRKLEETQKVLEAKQPNRMVVILRAEFQQVLQLERWKDLFASLLELLTSHMRQRGGTIFAPPRTAKVVAQAVEFDKDPNRPPPSVDDDVKKEAEVAATRPVAYQRREPRLLGRPWERRSSKWWARATMVLCTVLAIGIIVAGLVVLAVYIFFKPKMPCLVVSDAQLVLLQYDKGGTIQSLQMSITILAENNNSKADATFSRVDLALGFHGADVALLQAEPFAVERESSLPLRYNVAVAPGPALDPDGMRAMDESLKAGVVPFDLFGKARTRWKVGVFVKLRYWTRISCHLRFFFPGNGTVMPIDRDRCRSR